MSKNAIVLTVSAAIIAVVIGVSFYSQARKPPAAHPSPHFTLYPTPATARAGTTPSVLPQANPSTACTSADLSASLDSTGGGTAGTTYRKVVLTNRTRHSCTTAGFPGVSLVDLSGNQLGQPASRSGSSWTAITLQPGAAATANVGFPNPGNFDAGACSGNSANLKIFPPGQIDALLVPLSAQNCPGFSVQPLQSR